MAGLARANAPCETDLDQPERGPLPACHTAGKQLIFVLIMLIASTVGAAMAFVSPWLPVVLASILLFLGTVIFGVALEEGFWRSFGSATLAMILFQVSYVVAGRLRESRVRGVVPIKDVTSEE